MRRENDQHPISELAPEHLEGFQTAFVNRGDCYPLQLDKGSYVTIKKPLNAHLIVGHLKGLVTIGTYALNEQSQAKWLCLDADSDEQFQGLTNLAVQLEQENITPYLELSRRGGHLWLFTPTLQGKDIRQFGKQLIAEYQLSDVLELYPKQNRLVSGTGSLVRLPFGIHRKTGKRYHFVTPDGEPIAPTIREQIAILATPQRVPQPFIDQIVALAPEPQMPSPTLPFQELPKGNGSTLSEKIKTTVSVQQFVSQYVQLDQYGKGYCPFHEDDHQSFQVNTLDNYWHCYAGCGGGSIIDFWMKWRSIHGQDGSFSETIKDLKRLMGI